MINYKEITQNIKNNIITDEMILLACYSVNKRSKYYRNKCFMCNYNNYYENKKEDMYKLKRFFLNYFKPTCIHKEVHYKEKIINLDNFIEEKCENIISKAMKKHNFVRTFSKNNKNYLVITTSEINFVKYYLYYDINNYHFHYPINEVQLKKYPNLKIITLFELVESNPTELKQLLPLSLVFNIYSILNKQKVTNL